MKNIALIFLKIVVTLSIAVLMTTGILTILHKLIPASPKSVAPIETKAEEKPAIPAAQTLTCMGGLTQDGHYKCSYYLQPQNGVSYPITIATAMKVKMSRSPEGFTILTITDK